MLLSMREDCRRLDQSQESYLLTNRYWVTALGSSLRSNAMLENRKSPRRKMVLPVKISVAKETLLAHTLDISHNGARLGALRTELQPGTVVSVRRGSKKADFRVTWVRQLAANEVQVGIECLEAQDNFWGVNLSDQNGRGKDNMEAFMTLLTSTSRKDPR
jgi:PilZ domain